MSKTPEPSAGTPIDPKRIEFGHDNATGDFTGDTKSGNDGPGKQTKAKLPDVIGKVSASVDASGPVNAELEGKTVHVHSSWVKMHADVSLKADVDPDPDNFKIGWVQTLVSSQRHGIYKTRSGEKIGKMISLGASSDRRSYLVPNGPGSTKITVAKPWYDLPEEMSANRRTIATNAFDRPKNPLPVTLEDGSTLVAMKGGESFLTSLKAGNAGEHTLRSFNWEIPWDINLEGITEAAGKTGGNAKSSETDPNHHVNIDGRTAVQQAGNIEFETYETEGAAVAKLKELGYASFVGLLDKHKSTAQTSYQNMIAALWQSGAQMRVTVMQGKEAVSKGVTVSFSADGTFSGNQSGNTFTMLAHMVLDPNKGMKTPIAITVNGKPALTVASPYQPADGKATVALPGAIYGTNDEEVTVKFSIY